jgi:hypothetical protein
MNDSDSGQNLKSIDPRTSKLARAEEKTEQWNEFGGKASRKTNLNCLSGPQPNIAPQLAN